MKRDLKELDPSYERHSDTMRLVCFGPSLEETWEKLKTGDGDIWTVSGANAFLWKRLILPLYHMEADPRPHKAKLLEKCCPFTKYFVASRCSPEIFDVLKDHEVIRYHINVEDERQALDQYPGKPLVHPAWSIGLMAIMLGIHVGYTKFRIWAMDGCYREDGEQHPSFHPRPEENPQWVMVDERRFLSHNVHIVAASEMMRFVRALPKDSIEFVGDGMIPFICRRELAA